MRQRESKELLLSVFGVAILILVISGITYAIFRYTSNSKTVNFISTGAIDMSYIESTTNVITINDAIPISDNVGKLQNEYFDFTLSSTISGVINVSYEIRASKIETLDELKPEQVKVYLEKQEGGEYVEVLEPTLFNESDEKGMLLYSDSFINKENKTTKFIDNYRFRIWIDENQEIEEYAKNFKIKIDVYAVS